MEEDVLADRVPSIRITFNTGLYNPQTIDGDIVQEHLVSSTYTEALQFATAHSLLAPLRLIYSKCGAAPLNMRGSLFWESGKPEKTWAPKKVRRKDRLTDLESRATHRHGL